MQNKYLVVEANAGSGKTFNLVSRYLNLLFLGVQPEKIFALTFTKKATKEMFDRVLNSLQNPKNSGEISEIAKTMNLSDSEIELKAKEYFNNLINSEIKIMTLDSLEHLILKKFSHYLNIIPNYKIITEIDNESFQTTFLENIAKTNYKDNLLKIEELDSKMKIKSIFSELENLYRKEIEFYKFKEYYLNLEIIDNLEELEIFILEIANKISEWLLEPSRKLSNSGKKALDFSNLTQLLEKGKTWLKKGKLSEYSYFSKVFKKTSSESDSLEIEFEKLKYSLDLYWNLKTDMIFKNLFKLFEFYIKEREKFIKREQKFSFDDINHFLVQLVLDKRIDSQFIYFRLDAKIDHLLIDEFQDTSLLQYKVLQPIIDDILSGGSQHQKTFFYVGDKLQSLYRFRGGFSNLFNHLKIQYPHLKQQILPNNYRSKENIVNFVNALFGTKQKIGNQNQKGGNVILKEFLNPIDNIFDEVFSLIQNGIHPNHIAIICSKNSEINIISQMLLERNFEIQAETNKSIIEHLPAQSVTQYILYLYYLNDENSSFYLKNFQATIGKNPKNPCEKNLDLDISELSLFEIGVKIFQHFELFDGNENSLKFLESLENEYLDITDFVHNYKRESAKITQTEKNGINILTIHKAKGLEFENVIFLDFSQNSGNINKIKTIQTFEGIEVSQIGWNFRNGADSHILELIEQEQDTINKLYVALTRAKHSLTILKMQKKSALNLVQIEKIDFSKYQLAININ